MRLFSIICTTLFLLSAITLKVFAQEEELLDTGIIGSEQEEIPPSQESKYLETCTGLVTAKDAVSLTVSNSDSETGESGEITFDFSPKNVSPGAESIEQINIGDKVSVVFLEVSSGAKFIKSVEKSS